MPVNGPSKSKMVFGQFVDFFTETDSLSLFALKLRSRVQISIFEISHYFYDSKFFFPIVNYQDLVCFILDFFKTSLIGRRRVVRLPRPLSAKKFFQKQKSIRLKNSSKVFFLEKKNPKTPKTWIKK